MLPSTMTPLNRFRLSTEDNDDLGRAFASPLCTETERVDRAGSAYIVTTRMSERELRYLLSLYFGGENAFVLEACND